MTEPRCEICFEKVSTLIHKSLTSVYSATPYDVWFCSSCQNFQTFPIPTDTQLMGIYENVYAYDWHNAVKNEKRIRAKRLLGLIKGQEIGTKLIEFGSGNGQLLEVFSKAGFGCTGVEMSPSAIKDSVKWYSSIKIIPSTIEDFDFHGNENSFDLVVISHTLEHLKKPEKFIRLAHTILRPNGHLLIVVPNASNARSRIWGYWQVPVHLFHFTPRGLTALIEKNHFNIRLITFVNKDFLSSITQIINRFGIKVRTNKKHKKINPTFLLIGFLSACWSLVFHKGSDDLILLAQRKEE